MNEGTLNEHAHCFMYRDKIIMNADERARGLISAENSWEIFEHQNTK